MSSLEAFYKEIEEEEWDRSIGHYSELNRRFLEKVKELQGKDEEEARKLEAEREALAFAKHPWAEKDERLQPMKQLKTPEDDAGDEHCSYRWPDIQNWEEQDFRWVHQRFGDTGSVYLKTEYGLFLYCTGKLQKNQEFAELLEPLKELAESHYQKHYETSGDEAPKERFHLLNFSDILREALEIASERKKKDGGIRELFKELLQRVEKAHGEYDPEKEEERSQLLHLTDILRKFAKDAEGVVDLGSILEKNRRTVELIRNEDPQKGVDLAEVSRELCEKLDKDGTDWDRYKAELYETMAEETEGGARHLASVHFMEKAHRLYQKLGDEEGAERTGKAYREMRGRGPFQEIREDIPEEEGQRIHETIRKAAREGSSKEVLGELVIGSMFTPLEEIRKEAERKAVHPPLRYFAEQTVMDKFGNTVERYPPRDETWAFWETYGFHFQVGAQMLVRYFQEALDAGTIDEGSVIGFLEGTWFNDPLDSPAHPDPDLIPLDLLRPCLRTFFKEMDQWMKDPAYQPDLVSTTDALTLKLESMLRYLCYRAGIGTFKPRGGKDGRIVMEKNLEEILAELKNEEGFWEADRLFIKFVMTERLGLNLRNHVAHGLLDPREYSLEKPVLAFTTLMRLSKYNFSKEES